MQERPDNQAEAPQLGTGWSEIVYQKQWKLTMPTGHLAIMTKKQEKYVSERGKRGPDKTMTTYEGVVVSPTGERMASFTMTNDQKASMDFMADRVYRSAYGMAGYALLCQRIHDEEKQ